MIVSNNPERINKSKAASVPAEDKNRVIADLITDVIHLTLKTAEGELVFRRFPTAVRTPEDYRVYEARNRDDDTKLK